MNVISSLPEAFQTPVRFRKRGSLLTWGNDHGLPALHHPAGDPLAHAVLCLARGLPADSRGDLDRELPGLVQPRDGPAGDGVVLLEDLEEAGEGGLEVQRPGQRLAQLEQGRQLANLTGIRVYGHVPTLMQRRYESAILKSSGYVFVAILFRSAKCSIRHF
jgi:hypothetical protein